LNKPADSPGLEIRSVHVAFSGKTIVEIWNRSIRTRCKAFYKIRLGTFPQILGTVEGIEEILIFDEIRAHCNFEPDRNLRPNSWT
jgi:hypothetical protein